MDILETFDMEDSRLVSAPMSIGNKLSKNDDSIEVNHISYRSMIRKLQYVVHRKPNISLIVGIVARFLANPKENHMMVVKMIMRFLKDTKDCGLYYKKSDRFELKVFTNSYWVGDIDDIKSTIQGESFLGKRLVSWTRKKKNCVSQSLAKVEYVVAVVNCSIIMWIRKILKGMKEEIIDLVVI